MRVALVEDHALTRAGLRTALESAGLHVVVECGDGRSALDAIARERPEIAVVDVGLPGQDGIALVRALRERKVPVRVVILTMHELDDEVLAALAAGAEGYCVKASDPSLVIDAIRVVAAGGAFFDPRVAHVVLRRFAPNPAPPGSSRLTPRELDVLRLIADGHSNAEIAQTLFLGLGTVKGYIRDILDKLSASDRAQAAAVALRRGLLS
ncbi:MAG: response regulator transcription factor [Vulcanimicrobiaceae bacterium]